MFKRRITATLKPRASTELPRAIVEEVVPALRRREGFCGKISITAERRSGCCCREMNGGAGHRNGQRQRSEPPAGVVIGLQKVGTFEGSNSPFYKKRGISICEAH
jgi:hypothetical protein